MWQRIQTVFLVIAVISLIAAIFLPIWVHTDPTGIKRALYALHYSTGTVSDTSEAKVITYLPYSLTAILAIAAATIAIIEIGKYRNRVLQMQLGALNSLLMAGAIGSAVYFSNALVKAYPGGNYGLGLWLPGVAVICNLLANRFIRRDEKLVRDSDRLR